MFTSSRRQTASVLGAVLLAGLLTGGAAHAGGPVTTHNTGQGLAAGSVDPNYTYSYTFGADPTVTGQAVVLSPANYWMGDGTLPTPWDTSNSSTYQWVSTSDSNFPAPGNTMPLEIDYTTTFTLTPADLLTASLSGLYEADDSSKGVFLNGILLPGTILAPGNTTNGDAWGNTHAFSATSGLLAGTNTLTFKTVAEDVFTNGFRAQYDVNTPAVPEASTTASFGLLLMLGLGGVVLAAKKKKASAAV